MPLSFPNIGNAAEFVGQALGLRRPLRPPGRAFNNLRWVFDRARVPLDPLSRSKSQGFRQPRQADEASAAVQGDRPQLMQVLIPRANLRTQPSPAGKRARSSKRELRHASFSRIAIGTRSGAASASGGMIGVCSMANWPDSTACRTGVSRQKARGALHGRFRVAPQNSTQPPSRGGRRLVQP